MNLMVGIPLCYIKSTDMKRTEYFVSLQMIFADPSGREV